jgi:site-specific recombinase XerD
VERLDAAGVVALATRWVEHLEVLGSTLNTRKTYRAVVSYYLDYLKLHKIPYDSPSHQQLDAWILNLKHVRKHTPRYINVCISAVRNLYRWLKREGYVFNSAVEDLRMVRAPRLLPKPMPESEINALFAACVTAQETAMLEVLYGSGCRVSELVGMSVGDIDWERGQIRVIGKGEIEQHKLIGQRALGALRIHLAGCTDNVRPLWIGRSGGRLDKKTVRRHLREIAARAGVKGKVNPHRFRHSFATHMLDHGAELIDVQEMMGHASITTTRIYTAVSKSRVRKAYDQVHPRAMLSPGSPPAPSQKEPSRETSQSPPTRGTQSGSNGAGT